MGKISTTLSLQDNFSNKLASITNRLTSASQKMTDFSKTASKPIKTPNPIEPKVDLSGAMSSLDKIDSAISGIAKTAAKVTFTGLAAGATAVAGGLIASVKAAGDLEQSVGGVEKLFGNAAAGVMKNAENSYRTAGTSMNEYLEMATSYAPKLLTDLGGDAVKAGSYVDKALIQMSDNANTFGTDLGSLQFAYNGFSKGTFTMLDNLKLGYGGTQEEMIKLINDSGVLGHKIKSLDKISFSTMIDAIGAIQDKLNITGTTAKEAATTLNGSFTMMEKSFKNFLATGEGSDKVVDSILQFGSIAAKMTAELAPKLAKGIGDAFNRVKPLIPGMITGALSGAVGVVNKILGTNFDVKMFDGLKNIKFDSLIKGAQSLAKAFLATLVAVKLLKAGLNFGVIKNPFGKSGGTPNPFAEKGAFIANLKQSAAGLIKNAGNLALIYAAVKVFEEVITAVKQLESVPTIGDVGPKLLTIAVAVTSVGAAMVLLGLALDKIQGAKRVLITGAIGLLGISFVMKDLASAINSINENVPTDIGSMAAKMANVAIAVGSISLLAAALGALVTSGIGALIAGAGLIAIELIAHSMTVLSKAIAKINAEVPTDTGTVAAKIKSLVTVVKTITNSGLGSVMGLLKGLISSGQAEAANEAISALISISRKLQSLNGLGDVPDVTQKLKVLDRNVEQIQNASSTFGSVKPVNTQNAVIAFDSLIRLVKKLPELAAVEIPSGLYTKLGVLDTIIEKIQNTTTTAGTLRVGTVDKAIAVFSDLMRLIKKLPELAAVEIPSGLYTKLGVLDTIIEKIQNTTTTAGTLRLGTVDKAIAVFNDLMRLIKKLPELAAVEIPSGLYTKLGVLDTIIEKIQNTTTTAGTLRLGTVNNAIIVFDELMRLIKKLPELAAVEIPSGLYTKLGVLDTIIEKIQNTTTTAGTLIVGTVNNAITVLAELMNFISKLPALATVEIGNVLPKLAELDVIISKIQSTSAVAGAVQPGNISIAMSAVSSLITLVAKLNEVNNVLNGFVAPDLTAVRNALNQLSGLGGSDGISGLTSAVSALIPQLNSLSSSVNAMVTTATSGMTAVGEAGRQGMVIFGDSVKAGGAIAVAAMSNTMSNIISVAQSGTSSMIGIGAQIGNGLAVGMRSALGEITAAANQMVAEAERAAQAKAKIHSPSRLFRDTVGYFIGRGVAVGIDNTKRLVASSSARLINAASNVFGGLSVPFGLDTDNSLPSTSPQFGLPKPISSGFGNTDTTSNETNSEDNITINFAEGAIQINSTGDNDVDAERLFNKFNKLVAEKYNKNLRVPV